MRRRVPVTPEATAAAAYLAVLDASPNAIVGVDASARIVYANASCETTFGYLRRELIGEPVELLLPDRVSERHVDHRTSFMVRPVARPMGIGLDLAGRRKDGSEFPVEISLSPVGTDGGLQVFATIVDITARKAAEAQLLQAQKLESIGRLAGGIAHDFNNMLFAIRGYGELLAEDLAIENRADFDPDRSLRHVEAIGQVVDRATELSTQLLAFGRRQVVSAQVVELARAVHAIDPMLHRLIGEQIRLAVRLAGDTGRIRVDPGQLDQIIVNLVVNARDAMPDGGTITIESGNAEFDEPYAIEHFDVTPGRYVFLAVSDTGHGMDREVREHIFEPFFTTKEPGKGTGLGLATTYGIVRQAGGHIWLYSEPGRGSTFKLYFPRADEPATPGPDALEDEGRRGAGLVLVAEDEPAVRDVTTQLLERAGYRVTAVATAADALERIASAGEPVHALVTDVVMPGMSGIELAERVFEQHPEVRVVLLSGYTAETLDLERITRRGARFVSKPVSSRLLLAAVGDARPLHRRPR